MPSSTPGHYLRSCAAALRPETLSISIKRAGRAAQRLRMIPLLIALVIGICLSPLLSTRAANLSSGISPIRSLLSKVNGYHLLPRTMANYLPLADGETDLSVTKTVTPESAEADSDVAFTIVVRADEAGPAANVILTDTLPGTMTFVSLTQTSGPAFSCSTPSVGDGGQISCNIASLAGGESASFTLVGHIPSGTSPGTFFSNAASVTTETLDVNDENNAASATVFVAAKSADLGVLKSTSAAEVRAGANVTYSIEVRNNGPDDAANVQMLDTLPGTMTFVSLTQTSGPAFSCSIPAIGAGGTITCTLDGMMPGSVAVFELVGNIPSDSAAGTTFLNSATVNSDTHDENEENDISSVEIIVADCFTNPEVTTGADSGPGSLRQAIQDACTAPRTTIVISSVLVSQITLTSGELVIDKPLTIQGPGARLLNVTRDANAPNFRIFHITAGGDVTLSGMTISNGNSGDDGGGVLNYGKLVLNSVNVSGNSSVARGGGIFNNGTLTVINSTLSGNTTAGNGGAIYNNIVTPSIVNSTISGNSAQGFGGGIYVNNDGASLTNATVTNNRADSDDAGGETGGGIFINSGAPLLKNSIVAGNFRGSGTVPDDIGGGSVNNTSSFNLIGAGGSGGLINAVDNNQVGVTDPRLGPLANNGGPTQTHALLPGSPALDTGSNALLPADTFDLDTDGNTSEPLPVDQRGPDFQRVTDSAIDNNTTQTVDVGAFEAQVSVEDITDKATNEDTPLSFSFKVGDANLLTGVTATSSNTALVPNNTANLSVTGTGAARTLQITPVANLSGTTTITVTVTGLNSQTMTDTFLLTVNAVNDSPTVVGAGIADVTVNEDAPNTQINLAAHFADIDDAALTYTVRSNTNPSLFTSVSISGGTLTLDYAPNAHGLADITIRATDSGNKFVEDTFRVTVNAVNDAPTVVGAGIADVTVNEDAANTQINLPPHFADVDNATLTYTVQSNTNPGLFTSVSISGAGILTLDYAPNANGISDITIRATDAGNAFVEDTFRVTVNAVNDAPTVVGAGIPNVTVNEDAANTQVNLVNYFADLDNATLTYTVQSNTNPGLFTSVSISGGTLTLDYAPNANGISDITIRATDAGNAFVEDTFRVTVNAVNDAPQASNDSYSTTENIALSVAAPGVLANDTDVEGSGLTAIVVSNPANGTLTLNANGSFMYTPNTGFSGTDSFTYKARDGSADSGAATVTITVNDGGTLQFGSAAFNVAENGGSASVTITRTGGSAGTATVLFSTSDGTAGAGDYTTVSQTVTFLNGETSKTVNVPVTDDTIDEPDETVNLTLSQPGGSGQLGTPSTAVLTINDNEGSPSVSINDASVVEGNSGTVNAVFTVTLSQASGQTVTVDFSTADGTATAGSDYQSTSGTLSFAPGDLTKTIAVTVSGDTSNEGDETFFLNLTGAQNAGISDAQGLGTITNDDAPFVQFSLSSYQIREDADSTPQHFPSLTVDVVRGGDASQPATVKYFTSDLSGGNECNQVTGQASQRCDYTTTAGTLRFAAGETTKTISIPIINDGYTEGNEFFSIGLQSPMGISLGAVSQATLTIEDDDTVPTTPQQNPYLNNNFFVRQNYLDYLYREPDQAGFDDWVGVLNNCGPEKGFLGAPKNCDRAHVVHGFFASPEHIDSGFLSYRMYEVGMGRLPRYAEFTPDMATLSGFGISDAIRQQNLADYLEEFAAKQEFVNRFSDALLPSQAETLISKLEQTAGITLPATATTRAGQPQQYGRQELINLRASGALTVGQTLKAFTEQQPVYDKFFARGHVTLLYFAHLRRDPDLNDPNLVGWNDWVDVFTNGRPGAGIAPGDIHHLVFGFIYSEEYRKRFGQP